MNLVLTAEAEAVTEAFMGPLVQIPVTGGTGFPTWVVVIGLGALVIVAGVVLLLLGRRSKGEES